MSALSQHSSPVGCLIVECRLLLAGAGAADRWCASRLLLMTVQVAAVRALAAAAEMQVLARPLFAAGEGTGAGSTAEWQLQLRCR
jgi:hypothetical protein